MADKKTSDETAASTLTGAELIRGVQSGASVKVTVNQIRDYVQGALTALAIATGTITTSTPAIAATQTWNAGGVTFTALKLNVTDTASAAGSLLLDLQVGGGSVFSVTKAGQTSCLISNKTGTSGTGEVSIWDNSSFSNRKAGLINSFGGFSNGVGLASDNVLLWDSGTHLGAGTQDLVVRRDAANRLALQNGTSAQQFRVYGTSSSANANFERVEVGYNSSIDIYSVLTNQGGTGAAQALYLGTVGSASVVLITNSTSRWSVNSSGNFLAVTDNANDIGASGASRPRNIFLANNLTVGAFAGFGATPSNAQVIALAAATTSKAAINFASGVAPTSPNNGDFWFDGTDFKARVGGVTKTFTLV